MTPTGAVPDQPRTLRAALAALAFVFALAHLPFLATSLEDIDSVNFALGVRDFDVATHRPHPPGYPVYIALGKVATAIVGSVSGAAPPSSIEARALAILSLLAGIAAIFCLYVVFVNLGSPAEGAFAPLLAIAATVMAVACPLFWYLAARPMSDLPGLALALSSQACLMIAWRIQAPGKDGDRRLTPEMMVASGRMIVLGSLLAAVSIGLRSQTVWFTAPLLVAVLFDRVGRGVAGALLGGGTMFVVGGLAWGVPLLIASGGLNAYLAALGTQAGEDFTSGEMLYQTPTPRAAAFALLRTFVAPWDSTALAIVVLALATAGAIHLLIRDRRALVALAAICVPYLLFHLTFQDTSFVRYALPVVPAVAYLAASGAALVRRALVVPAAAVISIWSVAIAGPVLVAYAAEPSPTVRVIEAMRAEARNSQPAALAMHQTFRRPLEAEDLGLPVQLPSPPRLEWLELSKFWRQSDNGVVWFLADPVRSDLALIDPRSRADATEVRWPLVARPAFGGMRPSAVRWYRMTPPGWFVEEGWALTPETAGMARLMGRGPALGPIHASVRRRPGPARVIVGGRNLAGPKDPAARFTLAIDDRPVRQWDAPPGFFLEVLEVPAGALSGDGAFARLSIQSGAVAGEAVIPTAVEQFDLQDPAATMWAYDVDWHEAEYSPAFGVWRWTSDRSTLRIEGPPRPVRVTLAIESPLRYFAEPSRVRALAGSRELAVATIATSTDWTFDVPADALAAAAGRITIETDRTFVPAEQSGADLRRLGLRVFSISVANSLTPAESTR